jgi:hypothetical protein
MSHNPKFSNTAVSTKADAMLALLNSGYLKIYSGSQPADANSGIGGATLLATLRFSATAFGSSVNGVATANAITPDTTTVVGGTAAWYRMLKSDGTTVVMDGSVGAGGTFDLVLNTVTLVTGAEVSVSSLTYTESEG